MLVEEVSVVDRAANKRRFVLVKREDDMAKDATTPVVSDGKGGLTVAPTTPAAAPAVAPAAETIAKGEPAAPVAPAAATTPAPAAPAAPVAPAVAPSAEDVQKAGSKMKKERLERLRNAVDSLGALVKELSAEEPQPSAGAAQATATATVKRDGEPAADDAGLEESVIKLAKSVSGLAAIVTKQQEKLEAQTATLAEQTTILSKLGGTVTPSNAAPDPIVKRDPAPAAYPWPRDMAKDATTGEGSISFASAK
jgi:uncharacterized protein YoxC